MSSRGCGHDGTMHRYTDDLCERRTQCLAPENRDGVLHMLECLDCRELQVVRRLRGQTFVETYATLQSALMREEPVRRETREESAYLRVVN